MTSFFFLFFSFFSGKVCYKGNGNSRHPAITSKINQLWQFNNFLLNFRNTGLLSNQQVIGYLLLPKHRPHNISLQQFIITFCFARWENSWIPSNHLLKILQENTNRKSRRIQSSEVTFNRCVLALVSTHWHVCHFFKKISSSQV